jgi:hypothetical protein
MLRSVIRLANLMRAGKAPRLASVRAIFLGTAYPLHAPDHYGWIKHAWNSATTIPIVVRGVKGIRSFWVTTRRSR